MQKNKEARATENSAKETALRKALNGLAKGVRVLTVPPLMAATLLLILRADKGYFSQGALYWALFFLTFLPLASYGVWAAIPPLRRRGRDAQRSLAVIFSVAGYLGVALYGVLAARPVEEQIVFFTYLISGALIALFSFVFHIKSSGHACGVSGPAAMLAYRVSPWFLLGYLLLIPVWQSSLRLKRHTAGELLLGALFPVAAMALLIAVI